MAVNKLLEGAPSWEPLSTIICLESIPPRCGFLALLALEWLFFLSPYFFFWNGIFVWVSALTSQRTGEQRGSCCPNFLSLHKAPLISPKLYLCYYALEQWAVAIQIPISRARLVFLGGKFLQHLFVTFPLPSVLLQFWQMIFFPISRQFTGWVGDFSRSTTMFVLSFFFNLFFILLSNSILWRWFPSPWWLACRVIFLVC